MSEKSIKTYEDLQRYYRFTTGDEIGKGGFGKVFKAWDTVRTRYIAIKACEVKGDSDPYTLMAETQMVTEQIPTHTNIAYYKECYRVNVAHGQFDYAIMDYYPLGNLKQLHTTTRLNHSQKQSIALQILLGIQHLHTKANKGKGIIHRDLKPANILIAKDESADENNQYIPKIGDFGISKSLSSGSGHTSNSFAGGSLYYAAPEQLSGLESIGKNADLWSWGVLTYELYTGELPFKLEDSGNDESRQGRFYNLLKQQPTPPLLPTLPPAIQKAISRCLVFDKTKRLQTAEEVRAIITGGKVEEITEEKKDEEIDTIPPPKPDYPETPTNYPPKSVVKKTTPKKTTLAVPPPKPPESGNALLPIIGLGVLLVVVLVTVLGIYVNNDTNNAPPQSTETPVDSETQPGDPFANQMVYVQGGTFTMGCTPEQGSDCEDDEKPPYSKTVSNFYMGKYEVTQAQWRQVMGSNPPKLYNTGCDQCPVENVSHGDIQQFLKKLNQQTGKSYRLPTEAEWEYAARGGNKSKGYKYAGSNNIDAVAWYYDNYQQSKHGAEGTTHPVGAKLANELGLYDMSGNVWEWCQDWYKGYPGSSGVSDYTGAYRVLRGGSWDGYAQDCRVSIRGNFAPGYRISYDGFRLVVSP